MRKIYILITAILLSTFAYSQAPEKMSYQAVIRDSVNNPVADQEIGMQISILEGSVSGTPVYVETQMPTSNMNGLVSIEIGNGNVVLGAFNTIDWSNGSYFVKIESDPTGGMDYSISGTSQLLSVPYSLYAKTAGNQAWNSVDDDIYYNNGNVGIGNNSPSHKLDIIGDNTDSDGDITDVIVSIQNNNYSRYRTTSFSNTSFRNSQIQGVRARGTMDNPEDVLPGDRVFGVYSYIYNNGQFSAPPISSIEHFVGSTAPSGVITFSTLTGGNTNREERMRIDDYGNVGIGTTQPSAALQVANGDVYIENLNSGLIMKSPDGQCWRMTVDNSGNPVFSSITCP
jgi:hypothetical protein